LVLASVEPLSSKELADLLAVTLTAEQYNQALVELEVNGHIKVRGPNVAE
jgi:hypothetical protein